MRARDGESNLAMQITLGVVCFIAAIGLGGYFFLNNLNNQIFRPTSDPLEIKKRLDAMVELSGPLPSGFSLEESTIMDLKGLEMPEVTIKHSDLQLRVGSDLAPMVGSASANAREPEQTRDDDLQLPAKMSARERGEQPVGGHRFVYAVGSLDGHPCFYGVSRHSGKLFYLLGEQNGGNAVDLPAIKTFLGCIRAFK